MTAPAAPKTGRLLHVPALDGLRGAAVIGVLFFHAGHLRGGFLGVDLFFVLSGFLITSLLLLERDATDTIALGTFWARRARRLLPAMFAVVVAASVLAPVVLRDDELGRFRGTALASLGYVANWWAIARDGDYFALFDSPAPLDHFWSLAIEEQFYVLWPLLIAGALAVGFRMGWAGRRVVRVGIVVGIAASWSAMVVAADSFDTTRAYYGTDTRAGALLVGSLAATWTAGRVRRAGPLEGAVARLAVPAGVALAVSWALASGTDVALYRWGLPMHAVLVTVVIIAVTGPVPGPLGNVLSARPLRAIGLVSYGLYLWHWPIYVWLDESRTGLGTWPLTAVRLAVSAVVATVSYHALEQPIRRGRWPRTRALPTALVAAMACVLVVFIQTPSRDATGGFAIGVDGDGAEFETEVTVGLDGASILVVGDSGADALAEAFARVGSASGATVATEGVIGCGLVQIGDGVAAPDGSFYPDPPDCDAWPTRWRDLVDTHAPDVSILVLSWGGIGDRDLGDGVRRGPCDDEFAAMYDGQVQRAVDVLTADGGRVVLATTAPHGVDRSADDRTGCLNAVYRSVAERNDTGIVDLADFTCPDGVCDPDDDGRPDGIHYAGERSVAVTGLLLDAAAEQRRLAALPRVVFVGDSQAFVLVNSSPPAESLGFDVGGLAELGCGLHPDDVVLADQIVDKSNCAGTLDRLPDELAALSPDLIVVHTGVWEAVDAVVDGTRVAFGTPAWDEHNRTEIGITFDRLAVVAPVAVLTTPCFRPGTGTDALATPDLDERVAAVNEILESEAARRSIPVVDFGRHVCPIPGAAAAGADGEPGGLPTRPDGIHLDATGVTRSWAWLRPRLAALVATR